MATAASSSKREAEGDEQVIAKKQKVEKTAVKKVIKMPGMGASTSSSSSTTKASMATLNLSTNSPIPETASTTARRAAILAALNSSPEPPNNPSTSSLLTTPEPPSTAARRAAILAALSTPASPSQQATTSSSASFSALVAPAAGAVRDDTHLAGPVGEELAAKKRAFCEGLKPEVRALLKMEEETMADDWFDVLKGEFQKKYFLELKKFVMAEQKSKKVFPPEQDVYSWTRHCPLAGIRVVIIGQDPYHNDGQAHGLAFSVRKGIQVPPSLRNMYKELASEVAGFVPPKNGDLTSWAKQGVLMLNTSLTVRAHEAGSHSKRGWETFTTAVLKTIVDRLAETGEEKGAHGVVFLAWGKPAEKLVAGISEKQHHILKSAHPSPLSASRGFLGNGHFVKCNGWLVGRYGEEARVKWESVMTD